MSDFDIDSNDTDGLGTDDQDEAEAVDEEMTDSLDEGYPEDYPPERPLGVEEYGLTAAEEETGESLLLRVAREVPEDGEALADDEYDDGEDDDRISGLTLTDDDPDGELLGDVADDPFEGTEEEAAMHIVDEP